MDKTTLFTILLWMVLCIIFIIGQIVGANVFFVICNDIFAVLNGFTLIAMIPYVFKGFKNLFKKKGIIENENKQ